MPRRPALPKVATDIGIEDWFRSLPQGWGPQRGILLEKALRQLLAKVHRVCGDLDRYLDATQDIPPSYRREVEESWVLDQREPFVSLDLKLTFRLQDEVDRVRAGGTPTIVDY